MAPSLTLQYFSSPSQPVRSLPLKNSLVSLSASSPRAASPAGTASGRADPEALTAAAAGARVAVQEALADLLVKDLLRLRLGVGGQLAAQLRPRQGPALQRRAQQVGDVRAHAAVPVAVLLAAVFRIL